MEPQIYRIRPESPFTAEYPLSECDRQLPVRFIRKACIYAADENISSTSKDGKNLIRRLQESLKLQLQELNPDTFTYPQLLGRVISPDSGRPSYVSVEESSAIQLKVINRLDIEFGDLHRNGMFPLETITTGVFGVGLEKEDLIKWQGGPPNLAIQLTFVRGGFVLLLAFDHRICDGYAAGGFVKRWFRQARLGSAADLEPQDGLMSTFAIHDKTVLSQTELEGSEHAAQTLRALYSNSLPSNLPPQNWLQTSSETISKVFWIPAHKITELRSAVGESSSLAPTVYESVLTVLWRSIIRIRLEPETEPASTMSKAAIVMCMRKRLEPPLPSDYFGNAVAAIYAMKPLSSFREKNFIPSAVKEVQEAKRLDGTGFNLQVTSLLMGEQLRKFGIGPSMNLLGYDVIFNSWEHIYSSTEELDLGIGQFCTMRFLMDNPVSPSYICTLPTYGKRSVDLKDGASCQYPGGIELQICLLENEMALLERDEEWLKYAIVV
ncbi:transferase family domain-containing protein [Trichoderma austrokoningii]